MKAIFDSNPVNKYDDDITRRYHFPNNYLSEAKKAVGEWIIFRESQRGRGRRGYVAVARVERIEPDSSSARRHSYAIMSGYLHFDVVVPLSKNDRYYENELNGVPGPLVGIKLRGRSVRTISDPEFKNIVLDGFCNILNPINAVRFGLEPNLVEEEVLTFVTSELEENKRLDVEMLVSRKIRDAAFRSAVLDAYNDRCAITGLRIINGKGRAEAQAAHIQPVAENGPDVVQNGIALSATAHWLFDRHLIRLEDDYSLRVARQVPGELRSLFSKQENRIILPKEKRLWPYPEYIAKRRKLAEAYQKS